ncbi:MAG: apolipoprotein N-acyltransferase [Pseudomonadales bacterium]|nr:apolipoprotein N-acyltransferase [Pseudomonadales bacterium]
MPEEMPERARVSYLLALVAGALLPLSLAPFGYWPLGIVSLGLWFAVLGRTRPGSPAGRGHRPRAWLLGWLFGVGKYAVGASWVYVSINVYGHAPPWLAGLLVVLFVGGLALFTLANAVVFARVRGGGRFADAIWFAVLFVAFEWLTTWFLTGFPWLFAGYAHLFTPLGGLAPVGGVLLVSLAVALTAAVGLAGVELGARARRARNTLAVSGARTDRRQAALAAVLVLLPWLAGFALARVQWVQPAGTQSVALVQGNVDQLVKWNAEESARIIQTYVDLSEPHWDAGLLVWPEAAITLLEHEAADLLLRLDRRGQRADTAFVLGLPRAERQRDGGVEFQNAVRALGAGEGLYVKRRLVPFGEYVPLESWLRGLIAFFDLPMSGFSPGAWEQPLLDVGGRRAVMAICYEVVYPELVREQAAAADVLMTVSNDTWFGRSIGPLQHLEMAQMRALENGRWMLRGTNNGVTAIVDHQGRIRARLPQFEAGVLRGEWTTMAGTTPYARWGYLPVGVSLLLLGLLALGSRRPGA